MKHDLERKFRNHVTSTNLHWAHWVNYSPPLVVETNAWLLGTITLSKKYPITFLAK